MNAIQTIETGTNNIEKIETECIDALLNNRSYGFVNCLLEVVYFAGRSKDGHVREDVEFNTFIKDFVGSNRDKQRSVLKNYLDDHNLKLLLTAHYDRPKLESQDSENVDEDEDEESEFHTSSSDWIYYNIFLSTLPRYFSSTDGFSYPYLCYKVVKEEKFYAHFCEIINLLKKYLGLGNKEFKDKLQQDFKQLWSKDEILENTSDSDSDHTQAMLAMREKKAKVYDILGLDQEELKQEFVAPSLEDWLSGDDITRESAEIAIADYANINFDPGKYSSEKHFLGTMRWLPFNQDIAICHFATFNEENNNTLYLLIALKKLIQVFKSKEYPRKDKIKYVGGVTNSKLANLLIKHFDFSEVQLKSPRDRLALAELKLKRPQQFDAERPKGVQIATNDLIGIEGKIDILVERLYKADNHKSTRYYCDNSLLQSCEEK
ncbi:MAG: hypothetical protein WCK98_06720 [bacterium]